MVGIAPARVAGRISMSEFISSGAMGFAEVVGPIYDEINEMYGTDLEPKFKE